MPHLDQDPKEFALRQAIKAVARAGHNGTREQRRAANVQLSAAINAFEPERRKDIENMARNSIRTQGHELHAAAQNTVETREAEALNRMLEQCYTGQEQGLKR